MFVSVDALDPGAKTARKYDLPFPVLSDPDAEVLAAFNVVHELTDAEYERLMGFKIDVESYSQKKHRKIARAAMFLMGTDKTIRWAHGSTDYKLRPTTDQVLEALSTLP